MYLPVKRCLCCWQGGDEQWQGMRGQDPRQDRCSSGSIKKDSFFSQSKKLKKKKKKYKKQKHGLVFFSEAIFWKQIKGIAEFRLTIQWMCVVQKRLLWCADCNSVYRHENSLVSLKVFPSSQSPTQTSLSKPKVFTMNGPLKVRRRVSGICSSCSSVRSLSS